MKFKKQETVVNDIIEDLDVKPFSPAELFGTEGLSVERFIEVGELFEYYDLADISGLLEKLNKILLPDMTHDFEILTSLQKIDTISDISEATISSVVSKYHEVRTAVNSVLEIRRRYLGYKGNWDELITFVDNIYDRKKDSLLLTSEVKLGKSKEQREAKVNELLIKLLKQKDKLDIAKMRIKQFIDEITFTLDILESVSAEVSRVQSAIVLALDVGELTRVSWRQN